MEHTRKQFEAWIKAPPYEFTVRRFPNDETQYAWPGRYTDIRVTLAWEAWCEALENSKPVTDRLKNWIRSEGERTNICTYDILSEVCSTCKCDRKKTP